MRAATLFTLVALVAGTAAHAASGDSAVRDAWDAWRAGNSTRLAQAAADIPADHPLASMVESWQLRLALPAVDDARLTAFLKREDGSRAADKLRSDWLKSRGANGDWSRFAVEYPRVLAPDTTLQCYAYRADLAAKRLDRLKAAVALWFTGRDMPSACTPLFEQLAAAGYLNPEDLWRRLRLAFDEGNVGVARAVVRLMPAADQRDAGDIDSAARDVSRWLKPLPEQPSRLQREIAVYAIGRIARDASADAEAALASWSARLTEAERSAAWGEIGDRAARRHEPDALRYFKAAGPAELTDDQREWWVRAALRAGDWNTVAAAIDGMSEANRDLTPWRYWRARAYKAQGKLLDANRLFAPLAREPEFYGQLAQEELGHILSQAQPDTRAGGYPIDRIGRVPGIVRALALNDLDLRGEAVAEWNFTVQRLDDDRAKLAAAELARRAGWYDRAIYAAEQTTTHHDFELRFITPYRELASAEAKRYSLDEAWVYGLMRQESRFVPAARSSAGAAGLMQIMPATARWIADKLGLSRADAGNMGDPETNIRFGAWYLAHLLEKLDGSSVLATAGYNAGPGRAQRWRDPAGMEAAVFVESIPLFETRDYVRKVMSNAMYYAARFDQKSPLLSDRLGRIPPRPPRD